MRKVRIMFSFCLDGVEYFVVNTKNGSNAFKELMEEMMPLEMLAELEPEATVIMEQMLANMGLEYSVQMLINKENWLLSI